MSKTYFNNLDGLRFISFFLVFIHHSYYSFSHTLSINIFLEKIFNLGDIGVSFFFVLSGFLITYLLIEEKDKKGQINIPYFYFRRALRIWPLYYLIMIFGYFILPLFRASFNLAPNEGPNPYLCFTFLNNFDRLEHTHISSTISILWTVAIEEQFYLIWPLLFYFFKKKLFPIIILVVILTSSIFRIIYKTDHVYIETHTLGVITDMSMGGAFAFLSYYNLTFRAKIISLSKKTILLLYISTTLLILYRNEIFCNDALFSIKRLIISFLFSFIIVEQNLSKNSLLKIKNLNFISKLGIYTYGLYCYHNIAITIVKHLFNSFYIWNQFLYQTTLALTISIVISMLSYHFFEIWFLKLKNKYK